MFYKSNIEESECPICFDVISENRYITKCGHLFCYECIFEALKHNGKCPICRTHTKFSEGYKIVKTKHVYSSKISKLLNILTSLDGKVIVYTQFDDLRFKLCEKLTSQGIPSMLFTTLEETRESDKKVFIMSSKSMSSGLDLSFINNLVIFEPFGDDPTVVKHIEKQLIGRLFRISQEKPVDVFKLILKNTIEQELYEAC